MIIEHILSIIAPHTCLACGAEGSRLCADCAAALPEIPSQCYRCGALTDAWTTCQRCRRASGVASMFAVTPYEGVAKQSAHELKFERLSALAADMAAGMAARLPASDKRCSVVTYIPTATSRRRQRGYDQAALIAHHLARHLGVPCLALLARRGQVRQVGSSRTARLAQLRQVFRPIRPYAVTGRHILLVDDVLTTGASMEAAARTLRQAGAKRVDGAVFARTL